MHPALRLLAAAVNPLMLALLLAAALGHFPRLRAAAKFLFFAALLLLATFILAHLNRWGHLWKGHHGFPSGHITFLCVVGTLLALLNRRWLCLAIPLVCAYGWLLVFLRYHTPLDVLGALLLAPPVTLAGYAALRRLLPDQPGQAALPKFP